LYSIFKGRGELERLAAGGARRSRINGKKIYWGVVGSTKEMKKNADVGRKKRKSVITNQEKPIEADDGITKKTHEKI